MTRVLIIIGCIIGILTGGWFYLQFNAVQQFENALIEVELDQYLTYQGISINPVTGIITLSQPVLKHQGGTSKWGNLPAFNLEAETLQTSFTHFKDLANLQQGELSITGYKAKLIEDAELYRTIGDNQFVYMLVAMGYDKLPINFQVDWLYDQPDDLLTLNLKTSANQLGEISAKLSLDRLSLLETDGVQPSLTNLFSSQTDWESVRLTQLQATYQDQGFIRKFQQWFQLSQVKTPDSTIIELLSEPHYQQLLTLWESQQIAKNNAQDWLDALKSFVDSPNQLTLSAKFSRPISFRLLKSQPSSGKIAELLELDLDS
ncbi:hypothetical protein [Spartinivicinus poritis]|uniref:Uncharacterized protein n=1 Tax=Spartinivicinus poritis TaxID=2994640 RepID=A0ABT5U4F3_9GAMM|nr:hypothetical protein [Spartinivicinus sp. A2-2]MDE1461239.1 hypothetical protein [Spartinivicinus sp. A2-2]